MRAAAAQQGKHIVQFYEGDAFLADEIARFLRPLASGSAAIVITTPLHEQMLRARLAEAGLPAAAVEFCDAQATLAAFLVDGAPDMQRFRAAIQPVIARARLRGNGHVLAFGEMVALLWADGKPQAALDLEQLWNELGAIEAFDLLCAYPIHAFAAPGQAQGFAQVCDSHGRVDPTESYTAIVGEEELRREVARLQQRAQVLASEVERRTAVEARLREADREKDDFLATLGHELRNPLTPLLMAIGLAQAEGSGGRHLAAMERQATLMQRLVDDLLDASRLNRGKVQLRRGPVTLDAAVSRGVELAAPLLGQLGHRLVVDVAPGCRLDADVERLAQVFGNLLQNAAKYTPAGGTVTVTGRMEASEAVVAVSDDGQGFTAGAGARLFEPFVQGDAARGGLGLGLAVVRGVVELHGGSVTASSAGSARGSTFTVRLPLPVAMAAPARAAAAAPAHGPGKRVLVVDDEPDIREVLRDLLETLGGHEVRTAASGPEALAQVEGWTPDVVLCDLGMPGMDGFAVARALRARPDLRHARLVALSGYTQPADRDNALEAGFDSHVAKPPSVAAVLAAVAAAPDAPKAKRPAGGAARQGRQAHAGPGMPAPAALPPDGARSRDPGATGRQRPRA